MGFGYTSAVMLVFALTRGGSMVFMRSVVVAVLMGRPMGVGYNGSLVLMVRSMIYIAVHTWLHFIVPLFYQERQKTTRSINIQSGRTPFWSLGGTPKRNLGHCNVGLLSQIKSEIQ